MVSASGFGWGAGVRTVVACGSRGCGGGVAGWGHSCRGGADGFDGAAVGFSVDVVGWFAVVLAGAGVEGDVVAELVAVGDQVGADGVRSVSRRRIRVEYRAHP